MADYDTPKEVSPTEFSNVLFMNCHPDIETMQINLNQKIFIQELNYKTQDTSYRKAEIGNNDLRVFKLTDTSLVYRSLLHLEKNKSYTVIFYGQKNWTESLYLEDTLSSYTPYNSYVRSFHLSPDAPEVIIELKDRFGTTLERSLSYRGQSGISAFPTGPLEINVYDSAKSEILLKVESVDFMPGMLYTVVLRGFYEIGHQNRLNCLVFGKKFPVHEDN